MKIIWLYFVKYYISLGLFFYFKSIEVHGLDNIPRRKPLMILSNHQNALLDALLIATRIKGTAFFLTRASVFKKALVSHILKSLQMLPIYRIRDGYSNLGRNTSLFETISKTLNDDNTVVIFPEGSHDLARRVRPLSKGFTRIVFNTLQRHPNIDLQLQPVGLNYDKPKVFGSRVAIFCGKPIAAQDYSFVDPANQHTQTNELKSTMQAAIGELTTNIPHENYGDILKRLDDMNVDYLDPIGINNCIKNGFDDCDVPIAKQNASIKKLFKFFLVLCIPVPYMFWKFYIQPKVEELEFLSTFRFAVAITLVPLFIAVVCLIIYLFLGVKFMLAYLIYALLMALLAVKI